MSLKSTLLSSGAFGGLTDTERQLGRLIRDGAGHPDPAPAPAPSPQDDFDAAFAKNAADDPAPVEGGETPATPAASDEGASETPAEGGEEPAADGKDAEPGATPAEGDAGAAPAEAPAQEKQPTADDILKGLTEALKNNKPAEPAPAATEQPEPPAPQPIYSAEEQAALVEYEKNWPDVSQAEALKRRAEYSDIFKFVFSEVANYVAPLFDQMRAVGNTLHTQELTQKVPDYTENLEADVAAWVDTQPSYLQTAYKQVMQSGTSDEVADLIGRYREANGLAPQAATPEAAPAAKGPAKGKPTPAATPKTELSSAAKQAADSLAPVSGVRSAAPQGEDPQDFDSAFAKYAASGG